MRAVSRSDLVARRSIAEARVRARANLESNMISEVVITRGKPAVLLADGTLLADPDAPVVYLGMARLTSANGPVTYTTGEEVQFFSSASATVPIDVDGVPVTPQVNDLLLVTGHDDPLYTGKRFRIVDVEGSGLMVAARRLQLVGMQRYPGWEDDAARHPSVGQVPDEVPPEWRL